MRGAHKWVKYTETKEGRVETLAGASIPPTQRPIYRSKPVLTIGGPSHYRRVT